MLKVYLSVPIVVNRDLETAREIEKIIRGVGCEIVSPWVLSSDPEEGLTERGVFKRDTESVRKCDVLVSNVSEPSHGVGMEIMLAYVLGKAIVCTCKKGAPLSWLIKGMPSAKLVEYETVEDLRSKLARAFPT